MGNKVIKYGKMSYYVTCAKPSEEKLIAHFGGGLIG